MWKCGYRYLSCEKLLKICQLVPTLQIREQLVNICFFSTVSCSFLNASIHFLWTLNYAMTEYRVILLTANFSICSEIVSVCVWGGLCICVGVFVCVLGGCIPCAINLSYMWYAFMHSCQQFRVITTAAFRESLCLQPGYVPKRKPHYARSHKSIWGCTKNPHLQSGWFIPSCMQHGQYISCSCIYICSSSAETPTGWSRLTTSFSPTCPRGSTSTPRHLKCVWPWLGWIGWVLYL